MVRVSGVSDPAHLRVDPLVDKELWLLSLAVHRHGLGRGSRLQQVRVEWWRVV